jgi:mannose-6-phosphate isomerase-like protein (cupin superfamily)
LSAGRRVFIVRSRGVCDIPGETIMSGFLARLFGAACTLAVLAAPALDAHAQGRDVYNVLGSTVTVHIDSAVSRGRAFVFEERTPPNAGPPYHVHAREDEVFHVLEGRYRFWRGRESFEGGPGTVVYLPRRVPHTFRNIGDTPGRMFVVVAPAARLQRAFAEASRRNLAIPQDAQAAVQLFNRNGVRILGAPPSP